MREKGARWVEVTLGWIWPSPYPSDDCGVGKGNIIGLNTHKGWEASQAVEWLCHGSYWVV